MAAQYKGIPKQGETLDTLVTLAQDNPCPVLVLSFDGRLLDANAGSWLVMDHWQASIGQPIPEPWLSLALAAAGSGETMEDQLSVGMVSISLLFFPAVPHKQIYVFGMDVSVQKQIEQKVALNAKVFESTTEGILIMDADMRVIDANPAYSEITGYGPGEVLGETAAFADPARQSAEFLNELQASLAQKESWQGELWSLRKDGARYAESLSISVIKDESGQVTHYTAVLTDITLQKRAEEQLLQMAHFDMLTGLPNRRLFHDRLSQAILSAERSAECIAVMLVDLDGFKLVNDHLGHIAGDQMLELISQRIAASVRASDTVARMGGDEFLVLLRHLGSLQDAEMIADKILQAVSAPVMMQDHEIFLTASIGVSEHRKGQTSDQLMRLLDSVMYQAKNEGKNSYRLVGIQTHEMAGDRLAWQTRLRRALEQGEILPYYQGIFDTEYGTLAGLEVLARWQSPTDGLIMPGQFIPLAEESGLIKRLGEQILRQACTQGAAWLAEGLEVGLLSINVSAHQLHDKGFLETVERVLEQTGFPAERLDLELSEAIWVEGRESVIDSLTRLRAMGIRVSIDDFGTKYASLAYLRHLPVDRIKIDKSFMDDIPGSDITSAIVSAIMTMATSIGLEVVAEGIENQSQLDFMNGAGCRLIQGYLYGRPQAAEAVPALSRRADFRGNSRFGVVDHER
ncbi:putative bifunctional diguanylate cyclase/phosphodiesterase [Natronospirillum operosum]|nr:EAL domain-containing protein [Natronospirillum operosum]